MKQIKNHEMIKYEGGRNGYWTGVSCGAAVIGLGVTAALLFAATGPLAAVAFGASGALFTSGAAGACAVGVATGA